jgi:medium-chain acyl-[acyl-carrier-protein] hydrolase
VPADVEVSIVKLPGRGVRFQEPLFNHIEPLVEALRAAITSILNKPFAFFGHSMGAIISFELARALQRANLPAPRHLFVSGHRAPQIPNLQPSSYNLSEGEFICELRRLRGTPEAILNDKQLLQLVMATLRADFAICQTYAYQPGGPLSCSITALGGTFDEETNVSTLSAWRDHTDSEFATVILNGDHFFLESSEADLLREVSNVLRRLI